MKKYNLHRTGVGLYSSFIGTYELHEPCIGQIILFHKKYKITMVQGEDVYLSEFITKHDRCLSEIKNHIEHYRYQNKYNQMFDYDGLGDIISKYISRDEL